MVKVKKIGNTLTKEDSKSKMIGKEVPKRKGHMELPEKYSYLTIDNKFEEVLDRVLNKNENLFVTGEAGTGKTELLKIISDGDVSDKQTVVLATTGLASASVGGQTFHSFFKIPSKPIDEDDANNIVDTLKRFDSNRIMMYREIDRIIIDEVSMLKPYHVDVMDRMLRVCKNPTKPFGGTQIILFGDLFQLEPVVKDFSEKEFIEDIYDNNPFFFSAKALKKYPIDAIQLETIYRQKDDKKFAESLRRIRKGKHTEEDIEFINSAVINEEDFYAEDDYIYLTGTNRIAKEKNELSLSLLEGKLHTYYAEDSGVTKNARFSEELNLKVGAQVMMLTNDPGKGVVNGSMGIVKEIKTAEVEYSIGGISGFARPILVEFMSGRTEWIFPTREEFYEYSYNRSTKKVGSKIVGVRKQIPLKLAYAITIHKSQGMTLDRAYIDFGRGAFACGQTYVALSRVRNIKTLGLKTKIKEKDILVNQSLNIFI